MQRIPTIIFASRLDSTGFESDSTVGFLIKRISGSSRLGIAGIPGWWNWESGTGVEGKGMQWVYGIGGMVHQKRISINETVRYLVRSL